MTKREFYEIYLKLIKERNDIAMSPTEIKVMAYIMSKDVDYSLFILSGRKQVCEELDIHTTIYSTTLKKLAEKNFLDHTQDKGVYKLSPAMDKLQKNVNERIRNKKDLEIKFTFKVP